MWKAVSSTLPDVEVQGCNFHWNQAVYRYIQLEKVFLKKKHSCGFIFSKLRHTPIFLIHVNIFSIK